MSSRVGWNPTVRSRLEKFRFALFVSVPIVVGFGLGRYHEFWEFVEEWTRSAAANPKGPYLPKDLTEHRPTLQSEYSKLILEQALDAALEDARKAKSERLVKQA